MITVLAKVTDREEPYVSLISYKEDTKTFFKRDQTTGALNKDALSEDFIESLFLINFIEKIEDNDDVVIQVDSKNFKDMIADIV